MREISIPIWEKANLTLQEAAAYSGISERSLRDIIRESDVHVAFRIGNRWLINRRAFDEYFQDLCGG